MTYQFELDPDHKILLLRFQGRLTDAMMSELYWLIRQHSTATDAQAGIWDCSAVTDFGVSPEFIRQLVDRGPAMPDPTRRPRFFVAPPSIGLSITHLFEIAAEHSNPLLKIVWSLDEALAALGVPSPNFKPLE
jgi:hypothetical protein